MKIGGFYSFNDGETYIHAHHLALYHEVKSVIAEIDTVSMQKKISREKTMVGRELYSPRAINVAFSEGFRQRNWNSKIRVLCDYPTQFYVGEYAGHKTPSGAFREMDFIKDKLGVEVQFGKYAFMVYNVCAKMTIFRNLNYIQAGIEIVPMCDFANRMSTGVSYFEQFVWDLEQRGVSDIDIPVLVIGVY